MERETISCILCAYLRLLASQAIMQVLYAPCSSLRSHTSTYYAKCKSIPKYSKEILVLTTMTKYLTHREKPSV